MNNKLIVSGLILTSAFSANQLYAQNQNDGKKNILFIAVDDLKPLLGCYGDPLVKTPNIDKIAKKGVLFTHSYCQQAVSGPSRASLLTGMCPDRTQVWDLKTLIRDKNPDVVTLPQHFKNNGFETVGIGKIYDTRSVDKESDKVSWSTPYIDFANYYDSKQGEPALGHYQSPAVRELVKKYETEARAKGKTKKREINQYIQEHIKPSTETVILSDEVYSDGAIASGAVKYIKEHKGDKPLFLAVGFKKPHLPFCAPQKYWNMYNRNDIQLAQFRKRADNSPDFAYHNCGELRSYSDIPPLISFSDIDNLIIPDEKAKELIHGYYAAVSYMDAQLGKVLDALKEKGLDKNTIIILWGDHGWHLGDHGLWNKHTNFENATRVPLIIFDPSIASGKSDTPVEFLDIYPTLCDLAGIPIPNNLDGQPRGGEPPAYKHKNTSTAAQGQTD